MSSWDASSRPSWDPQGGTGENTQAFGVPDFPEEGGGFPSSTSPGTPPAIFLQDYDQNEVVLDDFGLGDSGRNHSERSGHLERPGRGDYGPDDSRRGGFGGDDLGGGEFPRNGFGQQDASRRGYGREQDLGQQGYGQRGPAPQDYSRQDNPWQDDQWQGTARDRGSGDYPVIDQPDPRGHQETEYTARMDPALRDFFAPSPARQDRAQPGLGQQRPGTRGYPGQGPGQGRGQDRGQDRGQGNHGGPPLQSGLPPQTPQPPHTPQPGLPPMTPQPGLAQANGHRQPNGFNQAPPDRWDTAAPRPGSRSARHQDARTAARGSRTAARGSRPTASIIIALVVVVGIAVGAFLLLHHKPATPAAQGGSTPTPTLSAPAGKSPSANPVASPASKAGYVLKTPATAGGYAKLASVPTAVRTAAGATASTIRDTVIHDAKGKVSGQVTAAYQLSGGQVLTFTGLRGTFSPAKVMASLAAFGTNSHATAPGPHGGKLTCMTVSGTPNGTVCVWVTTTTVGITEFFGSEGPEVVTDQAKAAADTLKIRDSVEAPKS